MRRYKLRVALLLLTVASLIVIVVTQSSFGLGKALSSPPEQEGRVERARRATIHIETEGALRDPELGLETALVGQGSGFIIDPSGIAVTNSHVVTGAGIIRVMVGFEEVARNAVVLGASECSDLAVIEIEGEGFPFLRWSNRPLDITETVQSLGFPLGALGPEVSSGSITALDAPGLTLWTAISRVIQHTAAFSPGGAGGPLLDSVGRLVGVNFGTVVGDQFLAIPGEEAIPVIEQLSAGNNITWIGINSLAHATYSGIWVAAIEAGSPADQAGLKAGDVITMLAGVSPIAPDGTKGKYCEVLRSHRAGAPLSVRVLRLDTGELLEGQINGAPLRVLGPIPEPIPPTPTPAPPTPTSTPTATLVPPTPTETPTPEPPTATPVPLTPTPMPATPTATSTPTETPTPTPLPPTETPTPEMPTATPEPEAATATPLPETPTPIPQPMALGWP